MYSSTNAPAQQAAYMPENNFAMGGLSKGFFEPRPRKRMNIVPIAIALFVPVALFAGVFALMSFSLHYTQSTLTTIFVILCFLPVLWTGFYAAQQVRKRAIGVGRESTWYIFLFISLLVAWSCGYIFGSTNYSSYTQPYYNVNNLMTYTSIDPSAYRGQQLMDAGRVVFTSDSALNTNYFSGFRNAEMYCVAPIVTQVNGTYKKQDTYDFWAVGTDCCSEHSADFACGEYDNPDARSGLRLTSTSQKEYYALAVEQAEATYGVKASNPVFMTWMQDPDLEVGQYWTDATRFFALVAILYGLFQAALVAGMLTVLSKLGW
mmetsp:Transcript_70590/g.184030  ORF Transcript_70590/g.184030 Transcript_70590/m.184030 type:complete len:319 (+) Transcript_70590:111-1067(+)